MVERRGNRFQVALCRASQVRERGGAAVMAVGWIAMMTVLIAVTFALCMIGLDLQEGRRQTQVVALSITRAVAVGGATCLGSSTDHSVVYGCLKNSYQQLPETSKFGTPPAGWQSPVLFGTYDPTTGAFNSAGTPVNAVMVAVSSAVRYLPVAFPQYAIGYFGGGAITLAPDPRSPMPPASAPPAN